MENETLDYRLTQLENKVNKMSDKVEIISTLEVKFTQLNSSLDKLSDQFKQFSEMNTTRNYEWLKYLATLIIGGVFAYCFKK